MAPPDRTPGEPEVPLTINELQWLQSVMESVPNAQNFPENIQIELVGAIAFVEDFVVKLQREAMYWTAQAYQQAPPLRADVPPPAPAALQARVPVEAPASIQAYQQAPPLRADVPPPAPAALQARVPVGAPAPIQAYQQVPPLRADVPPPAPAALQARVPVEAPASIQTYQQAPPLRADVPPPAPAALQTRVPVEAPASIQAYQQEPPLQAPAPFEARVPVEAPAAQEAPVLRPMARMTSMFQPGVPPPLPESTESSPEFMRLPNTEESFSDEDGKLRISVRSFRCLDDILQTVQRDLNEGLVRTEVDTLLYYVEDQLTIYEMEHGASMI